MSQASLQVEKVAWDQELGNRRFSRGELEKDKDIRQVFQSQNLILVERETLTQNSLSPGHWRGASSTDWGRPVPD